MSLLLIVLPVVIPFYLKKIGRMYWRGSTAGRVIALHRIYQSSIYDSLHDADNHSPLGVKPVLKTRSKL